MADFQTLISGKRGLRSQVARDLGITHGAVSQWRAVPAERVLEVERVTGISRHDLRPDIYPREPATSASMRGE